MCAFIKPGSLRRSFRRTRPALASGDGGSRSVKPLKGRLITEANERNEEKWGFFVSSVSLVFKTRPDLRSSVVLTRHFKPPLPILDLLTSRQ